MINDLTIIAGRGKDGRSEDFDSLMLGAGDTISIVGPTGSGKTALITDVELLAQGDTATHRRILVNGSPPPDEIRYNPTLKPIAMITQNTKCFTDLPVLEFLEIHARARGIRSASVLDDTLSLANSFTGEKIGAEMHVTILSGGQTRSLLIADALFIGAAPVILLDEIENAGIFKQEVLNIIRAQGKIVVFVTHDPVVALLTKTRLIMENGGIKKVLTQSELEEMAADNLLEIDRRVGLIREELRAGNRITRELMAVTMTPKAVGM